MLERPASVVGTKYGASHERARVGAMAALMLALALPVVSRLIIHATYGAPTIGSSFTLVLTGIVPSLAVATMIASTWRSVTLSTTAVTASAIVGGCGLIVMLTRADVDVASVQMVALLATSAVCIVVRTRLVSGRSSARAWMMVALVLGFATLLIPTISDLTISADRMVDELATALSAAEIITIAVAAAAMAGDRRPAHLTAAIAMACAACAPILRVVSMGSVTPSAVVDSLRIALLIGGAMLLVSGARRR